MHKHFNCVLSKITKFSKIQSMNSVYCVLNSVHRWDSLLFMNWSRSLLTCFRQHHPWMHSLLQSTPVDWVQYKIQLTPIEKRDSNLINLIQQNFFPPSPPVSRSRPSPCAHHVSHFVILLCCLFSVFLSRRIWECFQRCFPSLILDHDHFNATIQKQGNLVDGGTFHEHQGNFSKLQQDFPSQCLQNLSLSTET